METTSPPLAARAAAPMPPGLSIKLPAAAETASHEQLSRRQSADQEVARAFAETASRPPTIVSTRYDSVVKSVILTTYRSDTGSLVSQIPSQEMLAFAHRTHELSRLFLDLSL